VEDTLTRQDIKYDRVALLISNLISDIYKETTSDMAFESRSVLESYWFT